MSSLAQLLPDVALLFTCILFNGTQVDINSDECTETEEPIAKYEQNILQIDVSLHLYAWEAYHILTQEYLYTSLHLYISFQAKQNRLILHLEDSDT